MAQKQTIRIPTVTVRSLQSGDWRGDNKLQGGYNRSRLGALGVRPGQTQVVAGVCRMAGARYEIHGAAGHDRRASEHP